MPYNASRVTVSVQLSIFFLLRPPFLAAARTYRVRAEFAPSIRNPAPPSFGVPEPLIVDEHEAYEVEEILAERVGRTQKSQVQIM